VDSSTPGTCSVYRRFCRLVPPRCCSSDDSETVSESPSKTPPTSSTAASSIRPRSRAHRRTDPGGRIAHVDLDPTLAFDPEIGFAGGDADGPVIVEDEGDRLVDLDLGLPTPFPILGGPLLDLEPVRASLLASR
jgi:hypothetical protein